ncbi:P-selectin isoform X2 [Ictalurus punctatus]|uniref:E-selectin n=1 Tax=Ictalurus punctatus TaxID=7998 RepID=A0A2D0Q077_ICTPU|nr:P-selectin isoform X2 [Ictalurus punctatus]
MAGATTLTMRPFAQTQLLLYLCLTSVLVRSWTYTYSNQTMSWIQAKEWCENHTQILMFIQNEEDNNYLKDNLPKIKPYYWIGLRKTEDNWTWLGTAKMLEGNGYWSDNEPNNKKQDEDCVEIQINTWNSNGKWNDEKCTKQKHALCYNASCLTTSCSKHAQCVENISNYTCKCNPGFTGPKCMEAVECGAVKTPEQGFVQCSHVYGDFRFNSSCQFHCARGYILQGSKHLHCLSLGKWDHDPPECQVVECPPITTSNSGWNMTCNHPRHTNSYNSTCVFRCDEGFELRGSHTTRCDHTGQWTHNTPTCTVMLCKSLSVPGGGIVSCYRGNSTICTVQCPSAYLLLGGYKDLLMASSGCAAFSTICCYMFCCSYCRKRKKPVKQNYQDEMTDPVCDAGDAPLEDLLSSV